MFSLEPTSGTPIYQQLVDQVRQLKASGRLEAGAQLPSIRAVAIELGIRPQSIAKAYSSLEQEGEVLRHGDTDMVVAKTRAEPLKAIHPQALILVETAKRLGFNLKDTIAVVDRVWKSQQETP